LTKIAGKFNENHDFSTKFRRTFAESWRNPRIFHVTSIAIAIAVRFRPVRNFSRAVASKFGRKFDDSHFRATQNYCRLIARATTTASRRSAAQSGAEFADAPLAKQISG